MTCKWCDAELTNGSDICPICGRDQSAASVLDGILPDEPQANARREWSQPSASPSVETAPSSKNTTRAERARRKNRSAAAGWLALLLALVLLAVTIASNAKMSGRIAQLEKDLAALQGTSGDEQDTTEDSSAPEETSQSAADILTQKDIRVEFACNTEMSTMTDADTSGVAVSMPCKLDPSVTEDGTSFVGTVCYESETHCEVRYGVTEDSEGLRLKVSYDIIFSYLLGEPLPNSDPFTLRWRIPGEETWHPMETCSVIEKLPQAESTKAEYLISCGETSSMQDGRIELQVEIHRANENGGSLTVLIGTTVVDLQTGEYEFR